MFQARNRYLHFLIDANFQGVNRPFVLSFKDVDGWECYKQYYLYLIKYYIILLSIFPLIRQ